MLFFHVSVLHDTVETEYSSCYSEVKDYSVIPHEELKPLCGSFGYIGPHEIFLTWTIPHLHPSASINFTVVYMDLPFVALGCRYANLTLVQYGIYCGNKGNWTVLSNSSMMIELRQCPGVHSETGFKAVYTAIQYTVYRLIGNKHKILLTNDSVYSVSPLYASRQHSDLNTWHIVLEPYYQIAFNGSCQQDCAMYDGPGDRSQKIDVLIGLTSGFHLFIRQKSSALLIKFKAFFNEVFPEQRDTYNVHTRTAGNSFYRTRVIVRENNVLRLERLQTNSADILSEFSTYECLYGGIYIFKSRTNKNTDGHPEMSNTLRLCETVGLFYFLYPLPFDTWDLFIYIIFYTGYLDGSVIAAFQLQDCSVDNYQKDKFYYETQNACSKLILKLKPEEQMEFTMNPAGIQGPGVLRSILVSLRYKLHMKYSVTVTERDIFDTKSTHKEQLSRNGYYIRGTNNPTEITIREQNPLSQFLSVRMFIMDYIQEIKCRAVRKEILYTYDKSDVWIDLAHVLCHLALRNNYDMTVSYLVTMPTHFDLSMFYPNSGTCKIVCRHTNVTIKEYSRKMDAFIMHSYTSLPIQWHNLLSRSCS